MFLKSVTVKDVYGEPVVLSGEEVIKAYEQVIQNFMETRFFWLFHDMKEKMDKENISMCARVAAKRLTSVVDLKVTPRGGLTPFEREIYAKFKFDNFSNFDMFGE